MSFFTKAIGDTGRFFTKNIRPLGDNFFRKRTGGLDRLSRGLRQSSNVVAGLGQGVKQLSQSPVVLAGGTALGTYLGNPLLGAQIAGAGSTLGSGLEEGATILGAGREITNRSNYMTKAQKDAEKRGEAMRAQRRAERRERNELERQLPLPPATPPVMRPAVIDPEPVYSVPALDYNNPNVSFSFG